MSTLLVVPCYNEADRWNSSYWKSVVQPGRVDVLFVNDGSRDGTLQVLEQTAESVGAFFVDLPRNGGKAEAVRQGLLQGWTHESDLIGYLDADGAFPAAEVARMVLDAEDRLAGEPPTGSGTLDGLTDPSFDAVWSARVLMAGRDIQRHTSRHYLGRVITTLVAPWHGYAIYDTQAGFKIFRRDERLLACLQQPFHTRWFPDIELLQRWQHLHGTPMRIWEDPVTGWQDVAGSKMNASQYRQILTDLTWIYRGRT